MKRIIIARLREMARDREAEAQRLRSLADTIERELVEA